MKQNVKRINESQLRAIVAESVKNVLNEISYNKARDAFKKAGQNLDEPGIHTEREYNRYKDLYGHFSDRYMENFNPNMPVKICTTNGVQNLKAEDLEKYYEISGYVKPSQNSIFADQKMIGYPMLKGLIGPMWDGDCLRYEDNDTYVMLSI